MIVVVLFLQVALQEIRNQKNLVEQIRADLTLAKSNHSEEVTRYQQDIQILRVRYKEIW